MPSPDLPPSRRVRNGLRRAFRISVRLAVFIAVIVAIGLWLDDPLYALRLSLREAPTTLPVPVAGVTPRALHDTWQAARSEGRKHEGIDIFAPRGREVIASTEGLVWRLGENRLGGTVVWLLGPGRQLHYYAHLDHVAAIKVGDRVLPGDVLGYVGNTGNARTTPPHLHYGVYTMTGAINPFPLLEASRAK